MRRTNLKRVGLKLKPSIQHPSCKMDTLDGILQKYAAQGDDTKDKVLGAAFVVTSKDGKSSTMPERPVTTYLQ